MFKVHWCIDSDKHLNVYITNDDQSDIIEMENGQGDGTNGEQYALRFTTKAIEKEYLDEQ